MRTAALCTTACVEILRSRIEENAARGDDPGTGELRRRLAEAERREGEMAETRKELVTLRQRHAEVRAEIAELRPEL